MGVMPWQGGSYAEYSMGVTAVTPWLHGSLCLARQALCCAARRALSARECRAGARQLCGLRAPALREVGRSLGCSRSRAPRAPCAPDFASCPAARRAPRSEVPVSRATRRAVCGAIPNPPIESSGADAFV